MARPPEISSYPLLLDKKSGRTVSLAGRTELVVGRSGEADLPLLDIKCSRQQFRILAANDQFKLEPMSKNSPTSVDGKKTDGLTELKHGSLIQAGDSSFVLLFRPDTGADKSPLKKIESQSTYIPVESGQGGRGQSIGDQMTFDRGKPANADRAGRSTEVYNLSGPITLRGTMVLGRDERSANILLPHPRVSSSHAQVTVRDRTAILTDLKSLAGTYVNGSRIFSAKALASGDEIQLGPYGFQFDGVMLTPRERHNHLRLTCQNLAIASNRNRGLQGSSAPASVEFSVGPAELTFILCSSDSLLQLLRIVTGEQAPSSGKIFFNEDDLYQNLEAIRHDAAYVPVENRLHESLELSEALTFVAKMALATDLKPIEIDELVAGTLQAVGLEDQSKTIVTALSAPQRKLSDVAAALLSQPSLLVLEHPFSGEDLGDQRIVDCLQKLAAEGKTILVLTKSGAHIPHNTAKLLVFADSGELLFKGAAIEAIRFFGVEHPKEILEVIRRNSPEQFRKASQESALHRETVRLSTEPRSPRIQKNYHYSSKQDLSGLIRSHFSVFIRQTWLRALRGWKIQIGNWQSLGTSLITAMFASSLMIIIFGTLPADSKDEFKGQHFGLIASVLTIYSVGFGLINSSTAISGERSILKQEAREGLFWSSYLLGKFFELLPLTWLQVLLTLLFTRLGTGCELGLAHMSILLTLGCTGLALGFLVSAISRSSLKAMTLLPWALLVLTLFSGTVFDLVGMSASLAKLFSCSYWGYGAMIAAFPTEIEESLTSIQRSPFWAWLIICLQCIGYLLLSWVFVKLPSFAKRILAAAGNINRNAQN